jgi:hypothetical protein
MVAILRQAYRDAIEVVARRHGVSEQTIYTWRNRYGKFQVVDVRRLRQLEAEKAQLKTWWRSGWLYAGPPAAYYSDPGMPWRMTMSQAPTATMHQE